MIKVSVLKNKKTISIAIVLFAIIFMLITTESFDMFIRSFFAAEYLDHYEISYVSAGGVSSGGVYGMNSVDGTGSQGDKTLIAYKDLASTGVKYYSGGVDSDASTTTNNYWQSVTINSDGYSINKSASLPLNAIYATQLYNNNFIESEASTGLAKLPVITPNANSTARYSVIFSEIGTYTIYVYSPNSLEPKLGYHLIDSAADERSFPGDNGFSSEIELKPVSGCSGWYSGIIDIDNIYWEAVRLIVGQSTAESDHNITQDTTFTVEANNDTKYYNKWSWEKAYFATTLAFEFSNCSLGPIAQQGASITVNNNDNLGQLSYTDAFGRSTIDELGWVVFTPQKIGDAIFTGFTPAVELKEGLVDEIYVYKFDTTGTSLTSIWEIPESLATISVSGDDAYNLDFYNSSTRTTSSVKETYTNYIFTVNFEDNTAITSLKYTVSGEYEETGDLTADSDPVEVKVGWEETIVRFEATTAKKTYTITYNIKKTENTQRHYVAKNSSQSFRYIEEALMNTTSGTIEILNPGNGMPAFLDADKANPKWRENNAGYTVKSGVDLVIPYAEGKTTIVKSGSGYEKYPYSNRVDGDGASTLDPTASLYLTLIIPESIKLYVESNAVFAVGGTISGDAPAGATHGAHSNVQLNGEIILSPASVLSTCGYILGDGKITAKGKTSSQVGSKIYQPLIIVDYRGGGYTTSAAGSSFAMGTQSGEDFVSPFTRFAMLNIQATIDMEYGALMYAYCDLEANSEHNNTIGCIIGGNGTDGLIVLKDGASFHSEYDAERFVTTNATVTKNIGATKVEITGGASLGKLELSVNGWASITTDVLSFPVPYNYDISLNGEGSVYDIIYSMSLLPGATLRIGKGATLNLGDSNTALNFAVYDGLFDHTGAANGNAYKVPYGAQPNTLCYPMAHMLTKSGYSSTANFIVEGTLNIKAKTAFGGIIQAEGDEATINVSSTSLSVKVQNGLVGGHRVLTQYYFAGATVRTLYGEVLDRGTGNRTKLVANGKPYKSSIGSAILEDFTYDLYTDSSNTSTIEKNKTEPLNALVSGSWYNYEVTVHIVDANGVEYSEYTQYFCDGADLSNMEFYTDSSLGTKATEITSTVTDLYATAAAAITVGANPNVKAYYATLEEAMKAAVSGDTVILLKDLTLDKTLPIDDSQSITLDLAGYVLTCNTTIFTNAGNFTLIANTPLNPEVQGNVSLIFNAKEMEIFTNNEGATATIVLAQGITLKATETESAIINAGTLNINLNGATIELYRTTYETTIDDTTGEEKRTVISAAYNTQTIYNTGILSITDTVGGGIITSNGVSTVNTQTLFATTIYNTLGAKLSLDNVTISQTQDLNTYSNAIFNYNGSTIEYIDNCRITSASAVKTYVIENYGSTIARIKNSTIEGYYGIRNRNTRLGSATAAAPYVIVETANIGTIDSVTVNVKENGIYNTALIGKIIGTTSITAEVKVALNNANGWYTDNSKYSHIDETVNGETVRTDLYDIENVPTISLISGSASFNATSTAITNAAVIYEISGNVTIIGGTGGYGLVNTSGGIIDVIKDDVTISSQAANALQNTSQKTVKLVKVVGTYLDAKGATKEIVLKEEYYYQPSVIKSIEGNVTITAATSNGLYNAAVIDSITGNVKVTTATKDSAIYNYNCYADYRLVEYEMCQTSETNTTVTRRTVKDHYERSLAVIKTINGDMSGEGIVITAGTSYGLRNTSRIDEIIGKVTITAGTSYGIHNAYTATNEKALIETSIYDFNDEECVSNAYAAGATRTYYRYSEPSYIGVIGGEGCEINITATTTHGLNNDGIIDLITDGVTIKAGTDYGIQNGKTTYSVEMNGVQTDLADVVTEISGKTYYHSLYEREYTQFGTGEIKEISGDVSITALNRWAVYNYGGTIGEITNGVQISAKNVAIYNDGASATSRYANRKTFQYCYGTSRLSASSEIGEQSISMTITPRATINLIDNVTVTAGTTGIALNNTGYIKTITNSTMTSEGNTVITQSKGVATRVFVWDSADYKPHVSLNSETGKLVLDTTYTTTDTYTYVQGEIGLIGDGNTFTSAGTTTINNKGIINSIIGGEKGIVISGKSNVVYNYDGDFLSRVIKKTGTTTDSTTDTNYVSAYIGNISGNVTVTATAGNAIRVYSSKDYYTDVKIGELGEGIVVNSTTGNAISIESVGNALIENIIGGEYTAISAGYSTVYIKSGEITEISGGRFTATSSSSTIYTINPADAAVIGSISGGEFLDTKKNESGLNAKALQLIAQGKVISTEANTDGYYYITECTEHNYVVADGEDAIHCTFCGTINGNVGLTDDIKNVSIEYKNGDSNKKYFVIIRNGNNRYLIETVTYDAQTISFDVKNWTTKLTAGAVIDVYEDNAANNIIKLRGYQFDGTSIRFYSSILPEFCGDENFDAVTEKILLSNLSKLEVSMNLAFTLNNKEYTLSSSPMVINSVYNYLHNGDDGLFSFEDAYVFSVKTSLLSFASRGVTKVTLTLVETAYIYQFDENGDKVMGEDGKPVVIECEGDSYTVDIEFAADVDANGNTNYYISNVSAEIPGEPGDVVAGETENT